VHVQPTHIMVIYSKLMNTREALSKVVESQDLTEQEAFEVMDDMMGGLATPSQIGAFITALRMKGETIAEITGMARSMRKHAHTISPAPANLVDTCGTGGDHSGTFNISTTAALVAAGAGVPIAKHGNRSVTSRTGSADVLETLGVKIDLPPKKVEECINEVGIGFMFAPIFHGAMKHAIGPRKEIGIRTVFNILGPLTNPANAGGHLLGVFSEKLVDTMAQVLKNLGIKRAFIVHGADGLDEISITGKTVAAVLKDGSIHRAEYHPQDFGFTPVSLQQIKGGDTKENAEILLSILNNKDKSAFTNVTLLNAAAAIVAGDKARDITEGINIAREAIASGQALKKLHALIEFTQKC
jgi:anthranilate phosphoribosyltransferase